MCLYTVKWFQVLQSNANIAQFAGAAEYTDYISTEREDSPSKCSGYNNKQSDGEAPMILELWGIQSSPLLQSLPDLLWPGVVAPDRVLSMSQI